MDGAVVLYKQITFHCIENSQKNPVSFILYCIQYVKLSFAKCRAQEKVVLSMPLHLM